MVPMDPLHERSARPWDGGADGDDPRAARKDEESRVRGRIRRRQLLDAVSGEVACGMRPEGFPLGVEHAGGVYVRRNAAKGDHCVARVAIVGAQDHLVGPLDRGQRGRPYRLADRHPCRGELTRAPDEGTIERIARELRRTDHDEERWLGRERILEVW